MKIKNKETDLTFRVDLIKETQRTYHVWPKVWDENVRKVRKPFVLPKRTWEIIKGR